MATYANQKTIIKGNEALKDVDHPYVRLSVKTTQNAMKDLKGYEFQLYMLMCMNQKDFEWDLSPAHLEKVYGGTRKTWSNARKALEEKGYLVAKGNKETFYEEPIKSNDEPIAEPALAQVSWDF